jgi:hypothetical protein
VSDSELVSDSEIARMYEAADDHEAAVLDELRHRAGIVWTHRPEGDDGHIWTNLAGEPCDVCGKPQADAERDGET